MPNFAALKPIKTGEVKKSSTYYVEYVEGFETL